jgi:hypothetical protein
MNSNPTAIARSVAWLAIAGLVVVFGGRILGGAVRKAGV